jgi:hypothetical protein
MLDWREKYESLASTEEKGKFLKELSKRISELIGKLYDLDNNMDEFGKYYGLLRFVGSLKEKVESDGYDWD